MSSQAVELSFKASGNLHWETLLLRQRFHTFLLGTRQIEVAMLGALENIPRLKAIASKRPEALAISVDLRSPLMGERLTLATALSLSTTLAYAASGQLSGTWYDNAGQSGDFRFDQ